LKLYIIFYWISSIIGYFEFEYIFLSFTNTVLNQCSREYKIFVIEICICFYIWSTVIIYNQSIDYGHYAFNNPKIKRSCNLYSIYIHKYIFISTMFIFIYLNETPWGIITAIIHDSWCLMQSTKPLVSVWNITTEPPNIMCIQLYTVFTFTQVNLMHNVFLRILPEF